MHYVALKCASVLAACVHTYVFLHFKVLQRSLGTAVGTLLESLLRLNFKRRAGEYLRSTAEFVSKPRGLGTCADAPGG